MMHRAQRLLWLLALGSLLMVFGVSWVGLGSSTGDRIRGTAVTHQISHMMRYSLNKLLDDDVKPTEEFTHTTLDTHISTARVHTGSTNQNDELRVDDVHQRITGLLRNGNTDPMLNASKAAPFTHQEISSGDIRADTNESRLAKHHPINPHCREPRKNLLFLKTHKTGSSTLQNIVYRYGDKNGLTFALPVWDVYMGTPSLFKRSTAVRSPSGKYNMLANHARYNRPEMNDIMFEGAAYITIIRHPSTQFESMYAYYGFKNIFSVDLEGFSNSPLQYYPRQGPRPSHSALNPTLYDLGMAKSELGNDEAIRQKITSIGTEFDLVLIAEHFLESLILLKDLMCWDLNDVAYFSSNARTDSKKHQMSARTFSQLEKWNHGDALLYTHFNRTLWQKVEAYGKERMAQDVRTLTKLNEALSEKCLSGTKAEQSVRTKVSRYVLNDSAKDDKQCQQMIRSSVSYLELLRKRQKAAWRIH